MSADLVKRWRRLARLQEEAAAELASGRLGGIPDNLLGYAEALRRCADSLELSLARRAKRQSRAVAK